MASRGSTQCAGLSAYSAHTGSGISYNLVEKNDFLYTGRCLGANQPGVQGI